MPRPFRTLPIRAAAWLAALALLVGTAAAEPLGTGPTHRGVVSFGSYQVFPENRPGNAVYGDGVMLLSLPDQTLQDVSGLPPRNRFVYLARQGDTRTVAVRSGSGDPPARITEVSPGYYYVVAVLDGIAYKKVYRVKGANLIDLLPLSKTADGVTVGEKGLAFFHIAKADQPEDGDDTYTFGLHVALFGEDKVHHLSGSVQDSEPTLKLKWVDSGHIEYQLSDDTTKTLAVSDFR